MGNFISNNTVFQAATWNKQVFKVSFIQRLPYSSYTLTEKKNTTRKINCKILHVNIGEIKRNCVWNRNALKWCYLCFGLPSKHILNSNVLELGAFSFQNPDHREVPKSKHIILVQFFCRVSAASQPFISSPRTTLQKSPLYSRVLICAAFPFYVCFVRVCFSFNHIE